MKTQLYLISLFTNARGLELISEIAKAANLKTGQPIKTGGRGQSVA
jgi:hypothetical protein